MRAEGPEKIYSSFLSCEKDSEIIFNRLFREGGEASLNLKKLLVVDAKDVLDNHKYDEEIRKMSIKELEDGQYIRLQPKIYKGEHEKVKSYIVLTYDNFTPSQESEHQNKKFPIRDSIIYIDIISNLDYWDIGNFRQRPIKIMGYIDGLLNNHRLSGIGTLHFIGAGELSVDDTMAGYTLMYQSVHTSEDIIPEGGIL